jgi:hypothetical protein
MALSERHHPDRQRHPGAHQPAAMAHPAAVEPDDLGRSPADVKKHRTFGLRVEE